ncbi:MAG TPA: FAD binding domain-containing protein [Actinoplanes sp.]
MKPPRFTYHAPTTLEEATAVLREHAEDAKVLAGGQSLMPLLNFRLATPGHLVDINRLPGLGEPERIEHGWRIPALVRQRQVELSRAMAVSAPLLTEALGQVAHAQIRNRGTICGSLAHGDAAAELPSVMLALDARMTMLSADDIRTVAAGEFFLFHLTTTVRPDELLLSVEFDDPPPRTFSAFAEFALRKGDFCLAGAAVSVTLGDGDAISRTRVVVAGVAATPQRLRVVEDIVTGTRGDDDVLAAARDRAYAEINPTGDVHADAEYRRGLAATLVRRGLATAIAKGRDHA